MRLKIAGRQAEEAICSCWYPCYKQLAAFVFCQEFSMNRFPFLLLILMLSALCCAPLSALYAAPSGMDYGDEEPEPDMPTEMPGYSTNNLRELTDAVQRTGVGQDDIPSLNRPSFLSVSDADLSMDNEEAVFIIEFPNNLVRIYPQRILVWHEVVNDWLADAGDDAPRARALPGEPERDGEGYSITYSPLTGSVVAFKSRASSYPTSFGVSGILLNGNSLLYDRISHSLWSQLMAVAIEGPFRGKRLERIPVIWSTWRGAKARYGGLDPQFSGTTQVLSRATGFRRTYGKDPYGSYQIPGTYYDNTKIPFTINHLDTRLPAKKRILGIEVDSAFGAVVVDEVKERRVINFSLGMIPMVALYDQDLDAVRVFDRRLPGREGELTFIIFEDKLVDEQTRTEWLPSGRSIEGALREHSLKEVLSIHAMWFAWASFYRGTLIIPGKEW